MNENLDAVTQELITIVATYGLNVVAAFAILIAGSHRIRVGPKGNRSGAGPCR